MSETMPFGARQLWALSVGPVTVAVALVLSITNAAAGGRSVTVASRPARCHGDPASFVVARSPRSIVSIIEQDNVMAGAVIACWRPSGRRTRLGTELNSGSGGQMVLDKFDGFAFAGRFVAFSVEHLLPYKGIDSYRLEVVDVQHRRLHGCIALAGAVVASPIALSPRGAFAWTFTNQIATAHSDYYNLALADSRGVTILGTETAQRNVFSRLTMTSTRVTWREHGQPQSAAVHGSARIPSRCDASDVRPLRAARRATKQRPRASP